MQLRTHRLSSNGFTMIELLATFVVVLILASLLFPRMQEWTGRAQDAQCVQRLRSIQQAVVLYAGENSGVLPLALAPLEGGGTSPNPPVYDFLSIYLGNPPKYEGPGMITKAWRKVWWCPRGPKKPDWVEETYGYNVGLGAPSLGMAEQRISAIERPSKTAIISCIASNYVVFPWMAYTSPSNGPSTGGQLADWHSGGCNIAFLDGHILRSQKIDQNDPRSRWWNVNDPEAP